MFYKHLGKKRPIEMLAEMLADLFNVCIHKQKSRMITSSNLWKVVKVLLTLKRRITPTLAASPDWQPEPLKTAPQHVHDAANVSVMSKGWDQILQNECIWIFVAIFPLSNF